MAAYHAYENYEYFDMIVCYGAALEDPRRAATIYKEKYPERSRFPSFRVIKQVCERAKETGKLMPNRDRAGRKCAIPTELQDLVIDHIDKDRQMSIRKLARRFMTSNHVISTILERHGFVFNETLNHYIKLDKPALKRSISELKKKPKGSPKPKLQKKACEKFLMGLEQQETEKDHEAEAPQIKSEHSPPDDLEISSEEIVFEAIKVEPQELKKIQPILPKPQNKGVVNKTVMNSNKVLKIQIPKRTNNDKLQMIKISPKTLIQESQLNGSKSQIVTSQNLIQLNSNSLLACTKEPHLNNNKPQLIPISPKLVVQKSQLGINKPQIVTSQTLIQIKPETLNQEQQLNNKPQVIQLGSLLPCTKEQQVNNKPQIIQISPKPLMQDSKPKIVTTQKLIPISPNSFKQDQQLNSKSQIIRMLPCTKVGQEQLKSGKTQIIATQSLNNLIINTPSQPISPQQNLKNVVIINGTLYQLAPTSAPGPLAISPQQNDSKNVEGANKVVQPAVILLPTPTTTEPVSKPRFIKIKQKPEPNKIKIGTRFVLKTKICIDEKL